MFTPGKLSIMHAGKEVVLNMPAVLYIRKEHGRASWSVDAMQGAPNFDMGLAISALGENAAVDIRFQPDKGGVHSGTAFFTSVGFEGTTAKLEMTGTGPLSGIDPSTLS